MKKSQIKIDFNPLIILILIALATLMTGLYAWEKSKNKSYENIATLLKQTQLTTDIEKNSATENNNRQEKIEWKLVTSWPKNFPGLGMAPEYLAQYVEKMTNGQFVIRVFGANEIVPALGVFDAVSSGSVQAGHSGAYYWKGKIPASVFFTTIPFGMNAQETNAWLYEGGGLSLWQDIYKPHNLLPFPGGNTGVQMAGWFNKQINSVADLKGLRMRIPGLGGEVFKRVGGEPVNIPGGELYTALQTGVIDATEWVGPYNDQVFGFQDIAEYYYYPGWHEPGSNLEFIFNLDAWNQLPTHYQTILDVATQAVNAKLLNEYTAANRLALDNLLTQHQVDIRPLPDDVIAALKQASEHVIQNLIQQDDLSHQVYQSYQQFAKQVAQYHRVSEHAYIQLNE